MTHNKPQLMTKYTFTLPTPGRCQGCGAWRFGRTVYCGRCLLKELVFAVGVATMRDHDHHPRSVPGEACPACSRALVETIPIRVRISALLRARLATKKET